MQMSAQTLSMPEIITRLASKVKCGDDVAGAFLKEFSVVVTQGLTADGIVRIDGLGTFKVTSDVDGSPLVDFAPEASLAATVNEPFAMFDSVELADSLTDEELEFSFPVQPVTEPEPEPIPVPEPVAARPSVEESPVEESPFEDSPVEVPPVEEPSVEESLNTPKIPISPNPPVPPIVETPSPEAPKTILPPPLPPKFSSKKKEEPVETDKEEEAVSPRHFTGGNHDQGYDSPLAVRLEPESRVTIKRVGHTTLTLVVTAIAACLFGLMAGYVAYRYTNFGLPSGVEVMEEGIFIPHSPRTATQETADDTLALVTPTKDAGEVAADSSREEIVTVSTAATETVPAVVTDTVRPGNYLSVMARRHYGSAKFWVYIYIENKDKIKDPDNLENGMVIVIPPASKYGIDPSDKESLRNAEREARKVIQE